MVLTARKSKEGSIPTTERVRKLFEYHFAENNHIVIGKRIIERIIKKVANKTRISESVSPHVLRYTFSVNRIKKGISTRALQTLIATID